VDEPAPSRVATLRAAVLTAVLAVHCVAAAPLPQVVTPRELEGPVAREEVARWASRLTALGYTIDAEQLGERVVSVSGAIGRAHRALLAPYRPVFRYTGTGQGWALFANPDIWPSRLEVRVRRSERGAWELLYRRLDPAHPFQDPVIAYRRVRGVYEAAGDGRRPRAPYRVFAAWYAERILREDPGVFVGGPHPPVQAVEVRMVRTHTTVPPQPPDEVAEPRHSIIRRRERE
jgi:hypothetical protein